MDTTIVALNEKIVRVNPCSIAKALPMPGPDNKVFVIGHPGGGGLSLGDSQMLASNADKMHYRTPTEGGSSGSPVFNQNWELLAIHHAGAVDMAKLDCSGTYEANKAILIPTIVKKIFTTPTS